MRRTLEAMTMDFLPERVTQDVNAKGGVTVQGNIWDLKTIVTSTA